MSQYNSFKLFWKHVSYIKIKVWVLDLGSKAPLCECIWINTTFVFWGHPHLNNLWHRSILGVPLSMFYQRNPSLGLTWPSMMMSGTERPFLTSAHSAPAFQRPRLEIIIYLTYCKLLLCMSAFLSVGWVNMNCLIRVIMTLNGTGSVKRLVQ